MRRARRSANNQHPAAGGSPTRGSGSLPPICRELKLKPLGPSDPSVPPLGGGLRGLRPNARLEAGHRLSLGPAPGRPCPVEVGLHGTALPRRRRTTQGWRLLSKTRWRTVAQRTRLSHGQGQDEGTAHHGSGLRKIALRAKLAAGPSTALLEGQGRSSSPPEVCVARGDKAQEQACSEH